MRRPKSRCRTSVSPALCTCECSVQPDMSDEISKSRACHCLRARASTCPLSSPPTIYAGRRWTWKDALLRCSRLARGHCHHAISSSALLLGLSEHSSAINVRQNNLKLFSRHRGAVQVRMPITSMPRQSLEPPAAGTRSSGRQRGRSARGP